MVGLGTLLFLLSAWYWRVVDLPAGHAQEPLVPAHRVRRRGRRGRSAMEAGWVVSEVGRQPWIVYNQMKVEDAATANTGVWITFVLVDRAVRRTRHHDRADPAQDEQALPRRGRR